MECDDAALLDWSVAQLVSKCQCAYDGFQHFISSIYASQDSLMPMFSLLLRR